MVINNYRRGEHMRSILFICVFLFSLSCLFSIEDKLFDMEKVFMVKKQTIIIYITSSIIAIIVAVLYDCWLY